MCTDPFPCSWLFEVSYEEEGSWCWGERGRRRREEEGMIACEVVTVDGKMVCCVLCVVWCLGKVSDPFSVESRWSANMQFGVL